MSLYHLTNGRPLQNSLCPLVIHCHQILLIRSMMSVTLVLFLTKSVPNLLYSFLMWHVPTFLVLFALVNRDNSIFTSISTIYKIQTKGLKDGLKFLFIFPLSINNFCYPQPSTPSSAIVTSIESETVAMLAVADVIEAVKDTETCKMQLTRCRKS